MSGLMSDAHKEIFDVKLRRKFISDLQLDPLFLSEMRSDNCITEDIVEKVQIKLNNYSRHDAVDEFLTKLTTRPEKAFEKFVEALIKTNQDHLADAIDQKLQLIGEEPLSRGIKNPPRVENAAPADTVDAALEINKIVSYIESLDDLTKLKIEQMPEDKKISIQNSPACYLPHGSSRQQGRVIIINNEFFFGENHSRREGSDVDVKNLASLFCQFKFDVVLECDKEAEEMKDILKRESSRGDLKDKDILIVVLMSHGKNNVIYGRDSKPVDILPDVAGYFSNENCPQMIGKPKLFIIQACQNGDAIVTLEKSEFKNPDSYMAMSVVSGDVSNRHPMAGGWFIRATVSAIALHSHREEFGALMGRARSAVEKVKPVGNTKIQLPRDLNNLSKSCYLMH